MRVLVAGTSFKPSYGGPALSVARLVSSLAGAGVAVGLWSPDRSVGASPYLEDDSGVVRLEGELSAALRTFGAPDLIHDNGLWLPHNHRLALIAGRSRIPRVVSTRGMLEPWARRHKRWKKHLAWALYQRRDLCRAACHHVTSATEGRNLTKLGMGVPIALVPNGIDVPRSGSRKMPDPSANGRRVALFLGRIHPVKGLPTLIDAWASVRPAGWCLRIAGPDEAGHRRQLERRIASLALSDDVSFLGEVSGEQKPIIFRSADISILPSHTESFGMVVAESLAHGVPVLTTTAVPWPGLRDRGCGWLVEPNLAALTEGLRAATCCHASVLAEMGQRGREWMIAEFSWESSARCMIAAYEAALGHS